MATVEVKVPDIGDFKDVAVIELLVKVGDAIKHEQSLVTVESDKASMEIPASAAGIVKEIKVAIGDKVSEGSLLLLVEAEGAAQAAAPVAPAPASVPAVSSVIEVVVPDIGDFDAVSVIEVFVKPGDTIKQEQSLITVESDKASMEIPSSHAGVVKELKVKLGDKVAISVRGPTLGRSIKENDTLYTLPRSHEVKLLRSKFISALSEDDLRALEEIVALKSASDPMYGF